MRKVLSIVLALAMVLGCFASVFAATYTDVKADDDFATAVSVLSDLGVVSGYTDGTYKPEQVVTRAEMASLIVKALGLTPAKTTTTPFSDVEEDKWYAPWIAYASSLKIIEGYTDGTFKPTKTVSYDEAITMIVSALGYTADSLEGTTWPTAYVMKAQQLKITKGVELLGSAGANRGDIAELLYNTLPQQIGKTNKDGEFVPTTGDSMYVRLGAKVDTTATDITPELIKAETTVADLSDLLGAKAVLVKSTDGKKVLAVASVETEFVEGKYDATKKTVGTFSIKDYATTNTIVYLNGAKVTTEAAIDGTTYKVAVDTAKKEVVSAQYWKATNEFQVAADVKAGATKIDTTPLPTKTVDGKAVLDTTKFELVGADSIEAIKKNSIVTIYEAAGDGDVVKVEVSTDTVIGKITKVANGKATINGTEYTAPAEAAAFDKDYIVYLNYAGKQAKGTVTALYNPEEAEAETLYAVVLASGATSETSEFDTTVTVTRRIKLVDTTGAEQTLTVSKKADADKLADKTEAFKTNGPKKGEFVEYTLNTDGEIATMKAATGLTTLAAKTVKNGMVDGKALASDVVVFTKSLQSTDATFAEKAKITVAASIADDEYTELQYILNDKAQIAYVYAAPAVGAGAGDTFNGIYTGQAQVGKDSYEVYFLVGTEVKTIKATATTAAVLTAADEQDFGTFELKTDGTFNGTAADDFTAKDMTVATKGAINGSTFIADEDVTKSAVLSSSVVYYMLNEDGEWEVSDEETFLTVKGDIVLVDTATPAKADSIYDLVFFNGADCE